MATRRLRPEDWAPLPQTRIQIRAVPAREPKGEGPQRSARRAAINYLPGEAPTIGRSSEEGDIDSPGAPEIVDFVAPGIECRRGPPHHLVFQQQQPWSGRGAGSPGAVSQYSSRQSEMSLGILDYYTRDPSPTRSSTLPPTPKLPPVEQGPPKIGTPVIDPAMEKFDFGLPMHSSRPPSQACGKRDTAQLVNIVEDAMAGAQHGRPRSIERTPPIPPPKIEEVEPSRLTYSLFPKDTSPPSRPSAASRKDSALVQEMPTASNVQSIPSHQQPDPSYRPRKASVTSSLRSRKDSFTGCRANTQRIPLKVFSALSNSNPNSSVCTTPRTSNANPSAINPSNIKISPITVSSPPDSANSSAARSQSRWSEDTISSPVAALQGRRASFGSSLRSVEDERQSGQYPACFFEDDDDEAVPLRRKLQWGRSVSLQSQRHGRKIGGGGGEWECQRLNAGRRRTWRRWVLCGCGS